MNSEERRNPNFREVTGRLDIDGKTHALYRGLNTIGRNKTATVIIRNEGVSQQHAIITIIDEENIFVSDFQSFNGTFLENDNKLLPLQLYEISNGTEIRFANVTAVYKKVLHESTTTANSSIQVQHTQNVDDSFYAADTQAMEEAPTMLAKGTIIAEPPDCFDDDYNFADVPSPLENSAVNESTSVKLNPSIHDMPTQIYCSDVANIVSVGENQIEIANNPTVHDLPTQIMCHDDMQNNVEVVCKKVVGNKSHTESNTGSNTSVPHHTLHDVPTQFVVSKESKFENPTSKKENINNTVTSRDSINSLPTQPAPKSSKSKEIPEARDFDDVCDATENEESFIDATTDIIQETVLHDSGLDITTSSFQEQVSGKAPSLITGVILSHDSDSESNLHVSQLYRRTLKPIADDSDDITTPESDIVQNTSKKKNKQPLPETSPENSDVETNQQTKKCHKMLSAKESSGSETEIEDLEPDKSKQKRKIKSQEENAPHKHVSSGSETEVEELGDASSRSRLKNRKSKTKKLSSTDKSSGSDTDVDIHEVNDKPSTKFGKNAETENASKEKNDDSDTDIEDNGKNRAARYSSVSKEQTVQKSGNLHNSNELNDSDVIPATQVSDKDDDDDDDDFIFLPNDHSTVIHKDKAENTQESMDISQKLKELRNKTVMPSECSEESLNLGLTDLMENSDGSIKKSEIENDDDDKTPDISDIDEPVDLNINVTKPIPQDSNKVGDDIFLMATQKVVIEHVQEIDNSNNDDIFRKPSAKDFNTNQKPGKSKKTTDNNESNVDADEIFMQPTQPIILEGVEEQILPSRNVASDSTSVNVNNEDDIFLQATQKIACTSEDLNAATSTNEDDIFLQPTQVITLHDKSASAKIGGTDDYIFIQPTQPIIEAENILSTTNHDADIFDKPTQRISMDDDKTSSNDQPNQNMQPTQVIEINETINKSEDAPRRHKPSLSLIHKSPECKEKHHEIESQLEVMFASQTLQLPSETNSRPLNPLVNVFEGKNERDSEQSSEEPHLPKSPSSEDYINMKEYCELPTQPMDDLDDFQTIQHRNKQKSNDETTKSKGKVKNKSEQSNESTATDKIRKSQRQLQNVTEAKKKNLLKDVEKKCEESDSPINVRKSERSIKTPAKYKVNSSHVEPSTSANKNVVKRKLDSDDSSKEEENKAGNEEQTDINEQNLQTRGRRKAGKETEIPKVNLQKQKTNKTTNESNELDNESDSKQHGNIPKTPKVTTEVSKARIKAHLKSDNIVESKLTAGRAGLRRKGTISKTSTGTISSEEEGVNPSIHELATPVTTRHAKSMNKSNELNNESDSNQHVNVPKTPKIKIETLKATIKGHLSDKTGEPKLTGGKAGLRRKGTISKTSISSEEEDANPSLHELAPSVTTRHAKLQEKVCDVKESENAINRSAKNKNKEKMTKLESIQKDPGPSSSFVSKEITKRAASTRKSKTDTSADYQEDITPKKKAKIVENNSESSSIMVTGSRRVKRQITTDIEKNKPGTSIKKRKMFESSSESEEMNLPTPTRNKKSEQLSGTISTPDRNRRKQKPKVVFTMLDSPELESLIRSLGGTVVDSVEACTVLVTGTLKRSQKLLSAVGQGKPICSPKWLTECKKAHTFLDPWDFILEDKDAEKKWKFSLKESLSRSIDKKLLEDFIVHIVTTTAVDVLKAAIESCGGKCLSKVPPRSAESKFIVVASPDNKTKYSRFLKQKPPLTVVAPEAIFDGVLRQELHLDDHLLSL